MSAEPPFHVDPGLASRLAAVKESVWLKIGALQTTMNDRDSALDAFERVLRVNPANIYAMTQVGAVLAKKERYAQAVGYLQRAIAAESTCGEAWAVLAHCYVMTEDLPKAYQAYQNALNHLQDPSDPNLWYGIGLLYDRYGSLDNALEAFLAVLRIAPNFERAIEVCFCIGIIYKEQRKLDEAMSYFNKVSLSQNPPPPLTRADGWYQIGHVNELKRDISKALEMYNLALQENPRHAKTLQNLGWLEFSHKNNEREAIRLLQMSVEADANDGQTWYLLGRVYMQIKEFRQAYDAYQQAVYRDGNNATFWCSIGVLYYSMNQYRDAMDAYARAIRLNPSVSEVWFDLGTLYESCGQTNDAIDAYRRAADLAPENDQITSRLNHLQRTQGNPANRAHPQQQQSQPMSSQPALQPPHPQLPPPQGHRQHQQPHGMQPQQHLAPPHQDPSMLQRQSQQQQVQTSQHMQQQQPGQSQGQPHRPLGSHALQPLALRQPGSHGMQQPMQMVSQLPHPEQARPGQGQQQVQPLTRHIMQHPLQSTSAPGQHGLQDPMRQNPNLQPPPMQARHSSQMAGTHDRPVSNLPQLSMPIQSNQVQQSPQGQGPHSESGPRGDQQDPRGHMQSGQQGGHPHSQTQSHHPQPLSQAPQPLMRQSGPPPHGLPQLPSMQSQQENPSNTQHGQGSGTIDGARPGDGPTNNQQAPHMSQQGQLAQPTDSQYGFPPRPLTDSLQQRKMGMAPSDGSKDREGLPHQLEHIPALQHADGASQRQTYGAPPGSSGMSGPAGQMRSGPHMAPIPPLAPLGAPPMMTESKQGGGPDGQSVLPGTSALSDQRLPPSGTVGNANNSQPSTLKSPPTSPMRSQADAPSNRTGSSLPPPSGPQPPIQAGSSAEIPHQSGSQMKIEEPIATGSVSHDGSKDGMHIAAPSGEKGRNDVSPFGANQSGTPTANGGSLPSAEHIASTGSNSRNEDAKLLHSVAMSSQGGHAPLPSPPKVPVLNEGHASVGPGAISTGPPGVSSSPPIPGLAIPRSAPAPRPISSGSSSGLGASSLTKFGRAQGTPVGKSTIPSSLPSPLPPLRKGSSSGHGNASGIMASPRLSNQPVPPLKSAVAPTSGMEALPSPSSLPVLPALSGKGPEGNVEDSRARNPMSDGEKKMGSANGQQMGVTSTSSGQEKSSRSFGIPRSVPISSLSGGDNKGSISPAVRDAAMTSSAQAPPTKRECSPGSDVDKTHKRPRVQENSGNQGEEGKDNGRLHRRRSQENGDVGHNADNSSDVRMGDGNSNTEGSREHRKRQGDSESSAGRMGTPLLSDPGRPRSLTPRSGGPPSLPSNAPLPSFARERMNMAAGKQNSFGTGDSRIKSPVVGLSARSPGPPQLRSAPVPPKSHLYTIPRSQRPVNMGRPRDSSQSRSESDEKTGRNDGKTSGISPIQHEQNRRDSGVGDKEHNSPEAKVSEPTGTAS